ncbi:hypothetical protein N9W00_01890 [Arcobacteraceae bacterium]|nr:hypothetical protein [Arcobacteraceae bacterium]
MKKLSIISNQIKNNTYSYTGKGSFEAVVNKNKDKVLDWLDDLIPLQKQIDMLKDLENLEFQKRNYTRILTKLFPEEYKEFVSLNILVRDANIIAQYYEDEYNVTILYENLLKDKYLKYPGKYDKYVEYNIFQKFVMMYREDLMKSLDNDEQDIAKKNSPANNVEIAIEDDQEILVFKDETVEENTEETIEEIKEPQKEKKKTKKEKEEEAETSAAAKQKDTNWTQLLLGKLR